MQPNGNFRKAATATEPLPDAKVEEPIDRAYLARFTLDSEALEREVLGLFAEQLPLYVAQLRAAASPLEWRTAAHTIKGSALAVGARRLANVAQTAERLDVDPGRLDTQDRREQTVAAVAAAAEHARSFIACLFATA